MRRCALILRHGLADWPLKHQYDKVAGYCHARRLEIRKIYIDPTRLSVAEIRHDAHEHGFAMIIIADRSVANDLLPSGECWGSLRDEDHMELVALSG